MDTSFHSFSIGEMKWIKQSFIFMFKNLKVSLILAIVGMLTVFLSSKLNLLGAILTSVIFVFTLAALFNYFAKRPLHRCKNKTSLFLIAIFSVPTNIMMGSVLGILQGADTVFLTLSVVVVFSVFCALSYIIIAHIVGFIVLQDMFFEKALKAALNGLREHRLNMLMLSCLSSVILMLAALPMGLGLIIALPMHFYMYYFSYNDLYRLKTNEIDA